MMKSEKTRLGENDELHFKTIHSQVDHFEQAQKYFNN